ncbi:MAG: DUF5522 domain-containing protein [Acidimicrobiia bacterium]|nr:DUF5522 domain-containing protein [Acidimicrobiia bacterium]
MATFDRLRPDWLTEPGSDRFDASRPGYAEAMAAHRLAVEAGEPGYLDPEAGLFVMTAVSLRDRGWCCDCGCRHCPYLR